MSLNQSKYQSFFAQKHKHNIIAQNTNTILLHKATVYIIYLPSSTDNYARMKTNYNY